MSAEVATPETPLADIFAMPIDVLILSVLETIGTTVTLRLKGGNKVQVHGRPGECWTDVLAEAMELAVEDRRANA